MPTNIVGLQSLEFKNLSFKYPGTENYIFKNLNLKIESGKHYAIVGSNGSGKTTLTKLITGLYKDFEGDILINEKSIREYSSAEIKGLTSVVYQDFARYSISVKDNIALGNINLINKEILRQVIEEANEAPSLEIKNTSFSYLGSEKLIIDNINLEIKPKETIAIVGENGAGKSTLMKLILGVYMPTTGDVLFNGYNIKELSQHSIFSKSSAVFQKFQKYKFSLRENISISDIDNVNDEKIKKNLEEVEVELERDYFSEGLDTILSREFGGIDLSGGQWQRVAIARGLHNFSNLIVLDEPTAAIDPIEEGKIFNKFKEITKDKTAIIVTHRMGTVKIADRVVVLDEGKISEIGAHEEFIKMKVNIKKCMKHRVNGMNLTNR